MSTLLETILLNSLANATLEMTGSSESDDSKSVRYKLYLFQNRFLTNEVVSRECISIPDLHVQSGRNFLLRFVPREETRL